MVVNMSFIRMGCNNESILTFCPSHSGFIADSVCLFRCNLTWFEGLADLIGDYIMCLFAACCMLILPL